VPQAAEEGARGVLSGFFGVLKLMNRLGRGGGTADVEEEDAAGDALEVIEDDAWAGVTGNTEAAGSAAFDRDTIDCE
jgi:hypothetical protein